MTLCVCGHPSADHAQFDHGEYCLSCSCRDWRPIHKEAVDSGESHESTASLSAGVTPEGLARETVSGYVNPDGSGEGNWVTPPTDEALYCTRQAHRDWSPHRHHGASNADDPVTDEARAGEPRLTPCAFCDSPDGSKWHRLSCVEAAAAPALDVDRLAKVLEQVECGPDMEHHNREFADAIAAEYARLSESADD